MVKLTTHFYGVDPDNKYSRIAAKILKRKYADPYPLTHVCLQVQNLFIEYRGKDFKVTSRPRPAPQHVRFSYSQEVAIEFALDLLAKYRRIREDYPYNFSTASYFKSGVPWCTDFINRLLFNYQGDYLQQPPYELLDSLVCSETGFLDQSL